MNFHVWKHIEPLEKRLHIDFLSNFYQLSDAKIIV